MRATSERPRRDLHRHRPSAIAYAIEALEPRTLLSSVTQYHNDAPSTGQNLTEISLTPTNVNASTFGKLATTSVDAQVYAQPLYVPSVTITSGSYQGTHNVVYVATENDSLYAIDSITGTVLWKDSFLVAEPGLANVTAVTTVSTSDVNTSDITPIIGITGTPVIDGGNIYLAAATKQIVGGATTTPHFVYTLYQVNMDSGSYNSTVIGDTTYNTSTTAYTYNSGPYVLDPGGQGAGEVTASINGTSEDVDYFNALRANNRSALTAYDGSVYISFASHGDNGPYHGWILGYSESNLAPTAVFNANPNGSDTGIWEGGGAISIDPQGYMYVETGNGTFDTTMNAAGFPIDGDYGDSFIKIALDPTTSQTNQNINGWGLKVVDYFTPQNQASLSSADQDLGSGGPLVLPATAGSIMIGSATAPDLLVGSGKDGTIYLINRENMGKYSGTTDNIVQEIGGGLGGAGSFDTPSFYYNGTSAIIYYAANHDYMRAFTIANGLISSIPTVSPDTFGLEGATLSISANGDSDGVVWGIDGGTSELRAYNADNIAAGAIYSTATNSPRDALGSAVKFTVPTVADGEVFVGTSNSLVIYGLVAPPTTAPGAPKLLVATAVSNVQINLSWNDTATNAFGYYVEASLNNGTNWSQIATLGPTATSYSAIGLQANTTYTFRVYAYNSIGNSGFSNLASATTTNNAVTVNYPSGFSGETGLTLNSPTVVSGSALQLTNTGTGEAGSAFTTNLISVQGFSTTFSFQLVNATADGFTFTLQGAGPKSVGGSGGSLGYGGIAKSVAIKFDLYNNSGEGSDSTGLFVNGDTPTVPTASDNPIDTSIDMTSSGVNLHSGDVMQAAFSYDGANLVETVTDTTTLAVFTHTYAINIPSFVGSGYGYVGFTGGTGGSSATQNILTWVYTPVAAAPYAPSNLTVTPASGTELDLSWSEPYSVVSNFNIYELMAGTYGLIGQTNGITTEYASTGLSVGGSYSYEVVASNSAGNSQPAGPITGTTPTPPANPINLQASNITTSGVTLTWQDEANNATAYVITRQLESDNSQYVTTLGPNADSYTDSNLISGRDYEYEVAATNLAGPSAGISVNVETVPPAPVLSTPTGGAGELTLNWTDAAHALNGYNVYRGTSPGGENYGSPINGATPVTGTTFTDSSFSGNSTYYYTVEAVNDGGASIPSNETSAAVYTETFAVPSGSTLDITLSAAGPVNISASGGNIIVSQNGTQASVPGMTAVNVTDAGSDDVLNFDGPVAQPFTFVSTGTSIVNVTSGTLTFAAVSGGSINLGALSVADGADAVIAASASNSPMTLVVSSISLGAAGSMDVTNNQVLIDYGTGTDPISSISGWMSSGYNGGAWNGNGFDSSTVAGLNANPGPTYSLGYADGADGIVAGLSSGEIEITPTVTGDAKLSGTVSFYDFQVVLSNFGKSSQSWDQGDFDYSGTVDFFDFQVVLSNFGQNSSAATTAIGNNPPASAGQGISILSGGANDTVLGSQSDAVDLSTEWGIA